MNLNSNRHLIIMDNNGNKLLQFVNCRILRNHSLIREDLWVRSGKIVNPEKIFFDEKRLADEKIDCKGCIIAPGFIELQINGKQVLTMQPLNSCY